MHDFFGTNDLFKQIVIKQGTSIDVLIIFGKSQNISYKISWKKSNLNKEPNPLLLY